MTYSEPLSSYSSHDHEYGPKTCLTGAKKARNLIQIGGSGQKRGVCGTVNIIFFLCLPQQSMSEGEKELKRTNFLNFPTRLEVGNQSSKMTPTWSWDPLTGEPFWMKRVATVLFFTCLLLKRATISSGNSGLIPWRRDDILITTREGRSQADRMIAILIDQQESSWHVNAARGKRLWARKNWQLCSLNLETRLFYDPISRLDFHRWSKSPISDDPVDGWVYFFFAANVTLT